MKRVAVLGCTGSIGQTSISILKKHRDQFRVVLLANFSKEKELQQQKTFFPEASTYCYSLSNDKSFLHREETYLDVDIVINGIDGIAGLYPSYAVLRAGKILATANKESLVCAGIFLNEIKNASGGRIVPLDSEHSAVWQCLEGKNISEVKKIILTASGGAFRNYTKEELISAPASKALLHPNWKMGNKVTIDCATLVNKGMEIIEAKRLFNVHNVTAIKHEESIVHAMIEMVDNSFFASMSIPDMTLPIQYALFYPERKTSSVKRLELENVSTLHFSSIDTEKFPAYGLCIEAEKYGDIGGTILASADECLVHTYMNDLCRFYDISDGIQKALNKFAFYGKINEIEDVFRMEQDVREYILSDCCS